MDLSATARDVTGDALWAAMMLWIVSAMSPTAPPIARAGVALAICYAVEFSQLVRHPSLDQLRETLFGRLVLGSGFDPRDLVAYAGGILVALFIDRVLPGRSAPEARGSGNSA